MFRMLRFVTLVLAVVISLGAGGAWAQDNLDNHLNGTYAFTSKRTCTVAGLPFEGPCLRFLVAPSCSVRLPRILDSSLSTAMAPLRQPPGPTQ